MGDFFGDTVGTWVASVLDGAMKAIWTAALALLRAAFWLIDLVSGFSLSFDGSRPLDATIAAPWSVLRNLSLLIALGLFFWQLGLTALRGGRGFFQTAGGPLAYGVALAVTGGVVAAMLTAADELAAGLLTQGFDGATSFAGVLDHPKFSGVLTLGDVGQGVLNGVSAVVLGLVAIFGVIPAAIGYLLEMVFRQAAILVLVATLPISAAGLLAQTTSSWFWRTLRWTIAAILIKPALALVLVVGVSAMANPQGLGGLLAGVGLLLIALMCPFALFRLLAFVEPGTNAGAASRAWASSLLTSGSSGGGQVDTSSGVDSAESTNTARFDDGASSSSAGGSAGGTGLFGQGVSAVTSAAAWSTDAANTQMDATGVGWPGGGRAGSGSSRPDGGSGGRGGTDRGGGSPRGDGDPDDSDAGFASEVGYDEPPVELPPGRDGGPDRGGPRGAGGRRAAASGESAGAGEVAEAAVVL